MFDIGMLIVLVLYVQHSDILTKDFHSHSISYAGEGQENSLFGHISS